MQSLVPLTGDRFIGKSGANLNGSKVLTNWVTTNGYWTSSGNPAKNTPNTIFTCQSPGAACTYPQDLYLNNVPLVHQLALPIVSGQWYFDYQHDLVYRADNPTGKTVELSVIAHAFGGSADNVTVRGLIIENTRAYAGWRRPTSGLRLDYSE